MKTTFKTSGVTKNGIRFSKGDPVEVIPPAELKPWLSFAIFANCKLAINTLKLGLYFEGFNLFCAEDFEEAAMNCISPSVTGDTVEPDGWDSQGFPSILLAAGLI